jgi:hypothetical protein
VYRLKERGKPWLGKIFEKTVVGVLEVVNR